MNIRFQSFLLSAFFLFLFSGAPAVFAAGPKGPQKSSSQQRGVRPLQDIRKAEKANNKPQSPVAGKKPAEERARKVKERDNRKKERDRKQRSSGENRKKETLKREQTNRGGKDAPQR